MRDSQSVQRMHGGYIEEIRLPSPRSCLMEGVVWGRHDCLFTPAYWAAQAWLHQPSIERASGRIGKTFAEEVAVCLLGGHGMPAEVGLAAFVAIRDAGLLNGRPQPASKFEKLLRAPLAVNGRKVHYRFANQRATFLADAMKKLPSLSEGLVCSSLLRAGLLQVHGIGLKTASWIVRNWLGADDVAILDIHILRAGLIAGFFHPSQNIARDYLQLEQQFLQFASEIAVRPSRLDSLIWGQMKFAGSLALKSASAALLRFQNSDMLSAA